MKIAVEGCAHGELEKIYVTIKDIEELQNIKIDMLICCGDFQSTRNIGDLKTMAVPEKYQNICTFYKYYCGELIAPILTIFVGGNHEASNYLQELPNGGWVAPNIYYMGYAGVVNVNGIRIAGISGIYKGFDYLTGHHEFSPFNESTKRSVYHIRQLEVFRLKQLTGNIDIFLSHDWPLGIYNYGNKADLLQRKPFFSNDIEKEQLGSKPCYELLMTLKPNFWFSAHLHCKFAALVPHNTNENLDNGGDLKREYTKFLALDKCLPKRNFLQILEIGNETSDRADIKLEYDAEWLSILKTTNHLISVKKAPNYMPGPGGSNERYNFTPTEEEIQQIRTIFKDDFTIPQNFSRTVDAFNPEKDFNIIWSQPRAAANSQTQLFCDTLGIDDPTNLAVMLSGSILTTPVTSNNNLAATTAASSTPLNTTITNIKRSIGQLKLPCPTNKTSNLCEDTIDLQDRVQIPDIDTRNETNVEIDTPKTFRRRNETIYKNDDNE